METTTWIALGLFAITYAMMLILPKHRVAVVWISAIAFIGMGFITKQTTFGKLLTDTVDYNVLMMIVGTMGLVSLVIDSQLPAFLADVLVEKVSNVKMAIVVLALFSGIISAFVDNVATVLMVAPIALAIAKKANVNPVGMIIAIAVSSNLQGAATLVGDTTAIMLGGAANMSFTDFFWYQGKPSIFFAVEIGALLSATILLFIFRKEKGKIEICERTQVKDYVPGILLLGVIALLILASVVLNLPGITGAIENGGKLVNVVVNHINGIICLTMFIVGLVYTKLKTKTWDGAVSALKSIDLETVLLLAGLFIVIGGIKDHGVISAIASLFKKIGGGNVFAVYSLIVWGSVIISAFVDNIPYVATMLPVVASLASGLGVSPTVLYFGLLSGATLGGNITPVGASANITGIGLLRKEGYTVTNKDFFKIGIPFTLAAIVPSYIYIWLFYGV